jgi:hypothetical protein
MSSFKIQGVVLVVSETVQVSDKFKKREVVVSDTTEMYPQEIMVQFTQDKVDLLDAVAEGQEVEVSFNLNGRPWVSPSGETKYFNTLNGWKIEAVGQAPVQATVATAAPQAEDEGDLPF